MKTTISPERFDIFLKFIEFLQRRKALHSFLLYTTFFSQGIRALFIAQNFNPRQLIIRSFYWDYSENLSFWGDLNDEWQNYWDKTLSRKYNKNI